MLNSRAAFLATLGGTALQLAMVSAGHSNPAIAALFAIVGMAISLIAGAAYARIARSAAASAAATGGAVAGGACALIGILVSYLLGDVSMSVLILGTASSAVAGAIGGWLMTLLPRSSAGA
jgi:hypothetical protein